MNELANLDPNSLTVALVLLLWLIREIRARDKLSDEILEDYRDMKGKRLTNAKTNEKLAS